MGSGHAAGDVVSLLTVDTIVSELELLFYGHETAVETDNTLPTMRTLHQWIDKAVGEANDEIQRYTAEKLNSARTSGTTMAMAFLYGESVVIANIGDSRTYAWRNGELTQITRDHSFMAQLAEKGTITREEQWVHLMRNIILRAIGTEKTAEVDFYLWHMEQGDKLLLCTDGLWQAYLEEGVLAERLMESEEAAGLCETLVYEANERDGSDNISAVVVTVE